MDQQHDPLAHIRRLPIEIKRDLPTFVVDRSGASEDAFMRAEHFLGHVHPDQTYLVSWDGMVYDPDAAAEPLPSPVEPPHTILDGEWDSEIDLTIADASILGGNGRYVLPEGCDKLGIRKAEATPGHLAYYDCHLVPVGGPVTFQANAPLPVTVTSVGQTYSVDYLQDAKHDGGEYLEVHDRPHFHMPLDEEAGGHLFIGKIDECGARRISAFRIPFGYGILMAPWAIHADSHLIGRYMVIYSATKNFSTVIIRKSGGELANIVVAL